jgi:hypothetical protein
MIPRLRIAAPSIIGLNDDFCKVMPDNGRVKACLQSRGPFCAD